MKALSQRWHWGGGENQQEDCQKQKRALPTSLAWQRSAAIKQKGRPRGMWLLCQMYVGIRSFFWLEPKEKPLGVQEKIRGTTFPSRPA